MIVHILDSFTALFFVGPDIMIADVHQGVSRHFFLQEIYQILAMEGQYLDGQALDLQYFRFLFEFQG